MTQEELDALMAGDDAAIEDAGASEDADLEAMAAAIAGDDAPAEEVQEINSQSSQEGYRVTAANEWPPPPPTTDHKMVQQLDDVTRDSEEKATQMFDKLDEINNLLMDAEGVCSESKEVAESNVEVFEKLCAKFPNVATFKEALEKNQDLVGKIDEVIGGIQNGEDVVMGIMDMMQYQDIHRQKIERVINVMRALSKYMNSLFESSVDDKTRAPSAVHIEGDTKTENVMSDDDIEALINSLGKK